MSAARDELPAVARRRVRLALRAAREGTGLSQIEVAKQLGWSLSKVQRIELGEVTISPTDLRAVLDVYQVTDAEHIARLSADARTARRERYWISQEYRDHLPPGLVQLLQFERAATTIREYHSTLIPAYLQTPAVAEAILAWFGQSLSEERRRVRRDVRLARREQVLKRENPPHFCLLLDESALWRTVGGPAAAVEQFEELAATSRWPNVHIRVLPMDDGMMMGTFGYFMALDLSDDPSDAVLYREEYMRDEVIEDPAQVEYHRDAFERFWKRALSVEASRALILARVYDLRARIARDLSQDQGMES
ncbi:helix-turn-helix transcriptional regulator [Actinoplanes sp. NPDC023801]|uniref:helix-turn-helix domain-containing protein n=1 Tax=Actinoplanes sp. NPDC023801 TaxID=3154595 RepID=UPI0033C19174